MNVYADIPLVAAIIYVLMLGLLFAHRPWRRRHRIFAWFLSGALMWSVSNVLFRSDYLADYKLLLAKVTICSFTFMLVPFCYFVVTFYEKPRENWLALAYVPLAGSVILAAFGYLPQEVARDPSPYPEYNLPVLLGVVGVPLFILT